MEYDPGQFEVDGALRDLYVFDTGVQEWQLMMKSLPALGAEWTLSIDSTSSVDVVAMEDPAELFALLEDDEDASATLSIEVGEIAFKCYFFLVCEIEFTFDPELVASVDDFASLEKFMTWLGDSCRRPVLMTMEGVGRTSFPAMLEYSPQD